MIESIFVGGAAFVVLSVAAGAALAVGLVVGPGLAPWIAAPSGLLLVVLFFLLSFLEFLESGEYYNRNS